MGGFTSQIKTDTLIKNTGIVYESTCFILKTKGKKGKKILLNKENCDFSVFAIMKKCSECSIEDIWYLKNRVIMDRVPLNNVAVKDQAEFSKYLYLEPAQFLKELEKFKKLHKIDN